ncbi:MAG: hypothetical protein DMF82_18115 [Acidobacteria bacterium]|nr:MAG: hypothetical protein DMF82_18115 [Acidobacteriota bacterium]
MGLDPVQVPLWQVSAPLQALPSEQEVPSATLLCAHSKPVELSHVSVVQGLPSSHPAVGHVLMILLAGTGTFCAPTCATSPPAALSRLCWDEPLQSAASSVSVRV